MEVAYAKPLGLDLSSMPSNTSGLSFKSAFRAIERGEAEALTMESASPTKMAYEIALGVLFCGAWISYLPATGVGTSFGRIEYSDPPGRNDTFYPDTRMQLIVGGACYAAFLIAAIAIPIFARCYYDRRPLALSQEDATSQAYLSALKQKMQQEMALEPKGLDSLLPNAFLADIFPLLTPEDKKSLSFQQLKALRQHAAATFKSALKAHCFAEREEARWNKVEALLSIPLSPIPMPPEIRPEKEPLLREEKPASDSQGVKQLQAALENVSNQSYLHDAELLEVLIHELPLESEEKFTKVLAKHLEATHEHKRSVLSWEALALAMHRHKCSLPMAEKTILRLSTPPKHDVKFQVSGEHIVSANRQLLAQNSEPFNSMLFGRMRAGQNADPTAPFAMALPDVDATAFKALVALLEGQTWQKINCGPATVCALAQLADCYDVKSLYPLIEEQLIATMRAADHEPLDPFLAVFQQYAFLQSANAKLHLDYFLAKRILNAQQFSKPATEPFIDKLAFAIKQKLPKCTANLRQQFLSSIDLTTKQLSSGHAMDRLVHLLLRLGAHDEKAFKLLWKELDFWLARAPTALKMLWEAASQQENIAVQECIVTFCRHPLAQPIWLANWSTPPTLPKTQLLEIV